MSRDLEPGESVIARRLGPAAAEEWARVLRHFDLGEGFAFLVLLVPGVEIAELCIRDLESVLRDEGLEVLRFAPETPAELRELAPELVNLEPSPNVGAVWLEAVAPRQVPGAEDWIHAWIELTARLNERRDELVGQRARLELRARGRGDAAVERERGHGDADLARRSLGASGRREGQEAEAQERRELAHGNPSQGCVGGWSPSGLTSPRRRGVGH